MSSLPDDLLRLGAAIQEVLADIAEQMLDGSDDIGRMERELRRFNRRLDHLSDQLAALQTLVASLVAGESSAGKPARYILSVTDQSGVPMSTTPPATPGAPFQIVDNDKTRKASITYVDALNFPTTDPGATVAFASSASGVFTVDATSGAITPVAPGSGQLQATVTNSDGTTVVGQPVDIDIIAGPAVGFTINVG